MTATTQGLGVKYAVDLVMCIDGTGSMGHLINEVKSVALSFYEKLEAKMYEKQKRIDQLRAKVIVFRDYYADPGDMAMVCSRFFDLRTEASVFAGFVSRIEAAGGGDEPENGLEALALALSSDWEKTQNYAKQRHIVVVWTDASAHQLEKGSKPSYYPQDIPKTLDDLTDYWTDMSTFAKRLLLFAPDAYPWSILQSWDNTIQLPSSAGEGMEEYEMAEILDAIANSI
jgi:hypothetical protein